jgi:hypothetical protein
MAAEIHALEAAAAARLAPAAMIAARYVGMAEQAMALIPETDDAERRAAICWISEAWLSLAEAELQRRPSSRRE